MFSENKLGFFLSFLLHALSIVLSLVYLNSSGIKIDLDQPIYQVDLVSLLPTGGPAGPVGQAPAPAPDQLAKPEPKPAEAKEEAVPLPPQPKPEPPKPEPPKPEPPKPEPPKPEPPKPEPPKKPDVKAISDDKSAKTAKPEAKKEEAVKPPGPTPQELLANALAAAKKDAQSHQQKESQNFEKTLSSLRKSVGATPGGEIPGGPGGAGGGQGASGLLQVYGEMVKQAIKRNWRYPVIGSTQNFQASVEIKMDETGKITSVRLVTPSGRADFDSSVLKAITETQQIPPPPAKQVGAVQINFNLQEMSSR